MKAIKLFSIVLALFMLCTVSRAQSIQVTINNFNSAHTYYLLIKIYDYTASPSNICSPPPIQLTQAVTSNISICQVPKDIEEDIYQIKIWVEDVTASVIRPDQTGLLNSDDYYVGNIPLSVSL
jgi:hypothetical protein